uniref:NADH-ubiquinone oxidoreductase chain 1 n=1 Tax=Sarcoptes scabiei TaxID=52283 RepID=A0A343ISX6_SARSC|nr:NADH dehydrogenase subunit 1 [Sarcoptes scabiei]AST11110.1 NADH dehydrogenase subunit 1 [Sarcoptes scabiei]AST11136.1 NADH dehydrogenase subunit 1 [Sarcoptes scabiei]AST11149.1 NADH dehydrogenase subunit 1 [Sarcoptes scabiei]AST11162.1 NADH dehydrogenase subunit 1 [Sarcoptes scabiei]
MILNFSFLLSFLGVLLSVAFFTLVERKFMGLMHYRKGPNKVLLYGILQPISDSMKLFTKDSLKIQSLKIFIFFMGPLLGFFIMLSMWSIYYYYYNYFFLKLKIFIVFVLMSLSVYSFIFTSWGSNSKYSLLGGYRIISQVISYEICFIFFFMSFFFFLKSFDFFFLVKLQDFLPLVFFNLIFFFSWMLMIMAESNRTPFDLAEGESEIVSGFNIEYGGGFFALIFITEYGLIMFMSFLTGLFFFGSDFMFLKIFLFCFLFIWIRCSFPRIRYDLLMYTNWKICLPFSIMFLCFVFSLKL